MRRLPSSPRSRSTCSTPGATRHSAPTTRAPARPPPGGSDRHITVDEPDVLGRAAILKVHARNKPLANDVDLAQIADQTPGFTGADLANVINEAALLAIREGHEEIRAAQVSDAILRIIGGPPARGPRRARPT